MGGNLESLKNNRSQSDKWPNFACSAARCSVKTVREKSPEKLILRRTLFAPTCSGARFCAVRWRTRASSISTRAARVDLPGVKAVISARDVSPKLTGRTLADLPILALDRVRFVGDKVAAVAAIDKDTAEEALTLIDVEYEELPGVFDPLEALKPGAP